MKKKHVILIIGLLLVAFGSNAQENRYIKTDTYEGVIFANLFYGANPYKGRNPPYFPSENEIATMEKKIDRSISNLVSSFKKRNPDFKDQCNVANNLQKYKRHYFGYRYKGDTIIIINFFLNASKGWETGMNMDSGGGCGYLSLKYSIKTGVLYDFAIDTSSQ